jgi:sulfur carrier protein ThiS
MHGIHFQHSQFEWPEEARVALILAFFGLKRQRIVVFLNAKDASFLAQWAKIFFMVSISRSRRR